uniref:GAG-pre-integrase domain-containing protein n=1 Tax=Megaselia scalaris TaxID=36166 RepID=T1GDA3_MEGSC
MKLDKKKDENKVLLSAVHGNFKSQENWFLDSDGVAHMSKDAYLFDNVLHKRCFYDSGLAKNLLSISQVTKEGNKVVFEGDKCNIFDAENDLQQVYGILLHQMLAHLIQESMKLLRIGYVSGVEDLQCISCAEGKQYRQSFPKC